MNRIQFSLVALVVPLATNCSCYSYAIAPSSEALEHPVVLHTDSPYRHEASWIVLPPSAGLLKRARVVQHDEKAYDISAAYKYIDQHGEGVDVMLYLYPAPRMIEFATNQVARSRERAELMAEELKRVVRQMTAGIESGVLQDEKCDTLLPGGDGLCTAVTTPLDATLDGQFFTSDVYLFIINSRWFLRVHTQYLPDREHLASLMTKELLKEISVYWFGDRAR